MTDSEPTLTEDDFILEIDPNIKDDFKVYCIIIKQRYADGQRWQLATKIRDQILIALDLYKRLGEWRDGIKDGIIHLMPEIEYQKLIEKSEYYQKQSDELLERIIELEHIRNKLKAENEELRNQLTKQKNCRHYDCEEVDPSIDEKWLRCKDCGVLYKNYELIRTLQQENNQLKQLKERVEEIDLSFLTQILVSSYNVQKLEIYHELSEKVIKLQQLLKGDVSN